MSDRVKFHNMTKPVKFRRLKVFKQYIVLWCKALRERIIYNFNYLLYKLNILKRYSYRDNVVQVLPLPHKLKNRNITTDYFGGIVKMQLVSHTDIDIDYFYWKRKNGSKKITLSLKDYNDTMMFVESHLENIHIKVGEWFNVDQLPVFKMVSVVNQKPVAFSDNLNTEPVDVKTVDYDIMKLKSLCYKSALGTLTSNDISNEMLNYYYECSCGEFEKYLNTLTLQDIMM